MIPFYAATSFDSLIFEFPISKNLLVPFPGENQILMFFLPGKWYLVTWHPHPPHQLRFTHIRLPRIEKPVRNPLRSNSDSDVLLTPEVGRRHVTPSDSATSSDSLIFEFPISKNLIETTPSKNQVSMFFLPRKGDPVTWHIQTRLLASIHSYSTSPYRKTS